MKAEYFEIHDRYPISCKRFLPADGSVSQVILGVHGFAGDKESSMLEALAAALEPRNTALVCFDFPAHGASSCDAAELTVENCIQDLRAVAKWVEDTYPAAGKYLFATSFGGYISMVASPHLQAFTMIFRAPAVTMPKVLLEAVLQVTPREFRARGSIECGFERKIQLPYRFYEELLRFDPHTLSYPEPLLVIHGDGDDVVPLQDVESFCKAHPQARLVIIAGADHRFKKTGQIQQVVDATLAFMEANS